MKLQDLYDVSGMDDINGEGEGDMLLVGKDVRQEQREKYMWSELRDAVYVDKLIGWKLLNQITASGKTYGMYNEWIPELVKKEGPMIFNWLVTENAQKEIGTWDKVLFKALRREGLDYFYTIKENMTPIEVREAWDDGKSIVINVMTDNTFEKIDQSHFEWMENLGRKIGIIRDEFHRATSTSSHTTKANTGTKMPRYMARFHNATKRFIDSTPHLYGLSATFTNEMLGVVKSPEWGEIYHLVGDQLSIKPEAIKDHLKAMNSFEIFASPSVLYQEDEDAYYIEAIETFFNSLIAERKSIRRKCNSYSNVPEFNDKGAGLINIENTMEDVPRHWLGLDKERFVSLVSRSKLEVEDGDLGLCTYGVITGKSKIEYDFDGNIRGEIRNNDWMSRLENKNDPLCTAVTLGIGGTGSNVKNLTKALLLRPYNGEWKKQLIIHNLLQIYGRLARVNRGEMSDDEWNSLPDTLRLILYEYLNTFDLILRQQRHTHAAMKDFRARYVNEKYDIFNNK